MKLNPLEVCRSVHQRLSDWGVGYGNIQGFSTLLSPDPFLLTPEEFQLLQQRGPLFWDWLAQLNSLYRDSLAQKDLSWVKSLFEAGLAHELVDYQRSCLDLYPRLIRADQSSLTAVCEVQIPMSMAGWGFASGIARAYQEVIGSNDLVQVFPSLAEKFYQGLGFASGKSEPAVFLPWSPKKEYQRIQEYFTAHLQSLGHPVISGEIEKLADAAVSAGVDIVYVSSRHRCDPASGAILLKVLERGITVEPPMNLLSDQKISMIFPFHPQTREYFSDGVRSLFPSTALVAPDSFIELPGTGQLEISKIPELGGSIRKKLILKYAGIDPKRKSGGAAVYRLDDCNRQELERMFTQDLLQDYASGHPWIVQANSGEKKLTAYLTRNEKTGEEKIVKQNLYYRFNPFYLRLPNNNIELAGSAVTLRNVWKVHGQEDSVSQEVRIVSQKAQIIKNFEVSTLQMVSFILSYF